MRTLRSVAGLVTACAATAVLAACTSNAPVAGRAASAPVTAHPSAPPATLPTTAPSPAASTPATASAPATTSPAAQCATAAGFALPSSSITVCPAAGPVGSVVHVTIKDCAPVGAGLPDLPAAGLFFLGPGSWLGTDGGGGANVPYYPQTGAEATATFTIPATYTGGTKGAPPYPTLTVTPGTGYEFITDPAGECSVPFTVTAS